MPDVVHLRKDCADTNPGLKNCASTMLEMLNWVWGARNPSASSPLIIDIGPGEFDSFVCRGTSDNNRKGWVTVRGSGQNNTLIKVLPSGTHAPSNKDESEIYISLYNALIKVLPGRTRVPKNRDESAIYISLCANLTIHDLSVNGKILIKGENAR